MANLDPLDSRELRRLQLFVYLVPVLGFFPALWTLYRRQGDRKQQAVSRLAITIALLWLSGAALLTWGAEQSELLNLPFLLVSSLWTSGYFLISLGLMIRLWQGKTIAFPRVGTGRKPSSSRSPQRKKSFN